MSKRDLGHVLEDGELGRAPVCGPDAGTRFGGGERLAEDLGREREAEKISRRQVSADLVEMFEISCERCRKQSGLTVAKMSRGMARNSCRGASSSSGDSCLTTFAFLLFWGPARGGRVSRRRVPVDATRTPGARFHRAPRARVEARGCSSGKTLTRLASLGLVGHLVLSSRNLDGARAPAPAGLGRSGNSCDGRAQ